MKNKFINKQIKNPSKERAILHGYKLIEVDLIARYFIPNSGVLFVDYKYLPLFTTHGYVDNFSFEKKDKKKGIIIKICSMRPFKIPFSAN